MFPFDDVIMTCVDGTALYKSFHIFVIAKAVKFVNNYEQSDIYGNAYGFSSKDLLCSIFGNISLQKTYYMIYLGASEDRTRIVYSTFDVMNNRYCVFDHEISYNSTDKIEKKLIDINHGGVLFNSLFVLLDSACPLRSIHFLSQ